MAFYRRRPRPDAEKCADPAKARASALEPKAIAVNIFGTKKDSPIATP